MKNKHYLIIMLLTLWGVLIPALFMDKIIETPENNKPVLCYNEVQEIIKFRGSLERIQICLDYDEPLLIVNDELKPVPDYLKPAVTKIINHYDEQ